MISDHPELRIEECPPVTARLARQTFTLNWRSNSDELWRPGRWMIDQPVKRLVNFAFLVLTTN